MLTTDIIKHIRALCHPSAEAMPEDIRLTELITVAEEAADKLEEAAYRLEWFQARAMALQDDIESLEAYYQGSLI